VDGPTADHLTGPHPVGGHRSLAIRWTPETSRGSCARAPGSGAAVARAWPAKWTVFRPSRLGL